MFNYPLTTSQLTTATASEIIGFVKSPQLLAKRFAEIMNAQQFIGNSLLTGRYPIIGGAIAIPVEEDLRTPRGAEAVAPGAEYKLTPLNGSQVEVYTSMKEGLATEVTDESVGRLLRQVVDDAIRFLATEMVFSANELALGVIRSSVTQEVAASAPWTGDNAGKTILRDALRVRAANRRQKLGYEIDTVVLNGEQYAEVVPDLLDVLPNDDDTARTGSFPTISGFTWISSDDDEFTEPMFLDRQRLGGIARENIPSPEYRPVGGDTGVEVASIRTPRSDGSIIQVRNPHVPLVVNPRAGFTVTGTR